MYLFTALHFGSVFFFNLLSLGDNNVIEHKDSGERRCGIRTESPDTAFLPSPHIPASDGLPSILLYWLCLELDRSWESALEGRAAGGVSIHFVHRCVARSSVACPQFYSDEKNRTVCC